MLPVSSASWASTAATAGRRRTRRIGGFGRIADFLAKRARFDEDLWAIELDIAEPERFIAETTGRVDPAACGGNPLNNKSGGHSW